MEDPDTQKPDWGTVMSSLTSIPVKIKEPLTQKLRPLPQYKVIKILEDNGFQRVRSHITKGKRLQVWVCDQASALRVERRSPLESCGNIFSDQASALRVEPAYKCKQSDGNCNQCLLPQLLIVHVLLPQPVERMCENYIRATNHSYK